MRDMNILSLFFVLLLVNLASASVESDILGYVNQERISKNIPALNVNSMLTTAAELHAADMSANNYLSHTSKDGRTFVQRITAQGYNYNYLGENIAYHSGAASALQVYTMWKNSPGHYSNMMSANFKEIGIGVSNNGANTYYVQDFGSRSGYIPPSTPPPVINTTPPQNTTPPPTTQPPTTPPTTQPPTTTPPPTTQPTPVYTYIKPKIILVGSDSGNTNGNLLIELPKYDYSDIALIVGTNQIPIQAKNCESSSQFSCKIRPDLSSMHNTTQIFFVVATVNRGNNATTELKSAILRLKIDTKSPILTNFTHNVSKGYLTVSAKIDELYLDYIEYNDTATPGKEMKLNFRITKGNLVSKKYFKAGLHSLDMVLVDKAGNSIKRSIEFTSII